MPSGAPGQSGHPPVGSGSDAVRGQWSNARLGAMKGRHEAGNGGEYLGDDLTALTCWGRRPSS